jgi:hypothetical protein
MNHCSEEDLILHYYGEADRRAAIERHLATCAPCAAEYRALAAALSQMTAPEPPGRGEHYGLEVWQKIRHRLPEQDTRGWAWPLSERWMLAAGVTALLVAALFTGRLTLWQTGRAAAPTAATRSSDGGQEMLLISVADHLDRSARVLTDIMDAPNRGDISTEQHWADDLLTASRFYRQDAIDARETSVADVLDALERSLVEIVHSPSMVNAAQLEDLRRRIDATALLFKVRVLSQQLRTTTTHPS